jgi:signal peptidase I
VLSVSIPSKRQETESSLLLSLYVEALHQGRSTWFRVVSGSMRPCVRVGDAVHVQPVSPRDLQVGDIAAFETPVGLVVHRIVHILPPEKLARFIEMGDVMLEAHEITEQAVAGRVSAIRRGSLLIDLRKPLAKRLGGVTARLRYRLYCQYAISKQNLPRLLVRKTARLAVRAGSTLIRYTCTCVDHESPPLIGTI